MEPDLKIDLREATDEKISIIVVHRDRPELLNICLQTIAVTTVNNNIEIIVVDNGSTTQDSLDYLKVLEKEPDITLIKNDTNKWLATAYNQGARAADKRSKYLVFMHQDCNILNPGWLDLMVSIAEMRKSGIVGLENGVFNYDRQDIPYIQDWCMMVSRDCWQDCGPFHEELKQIGISLVLMLTAQRYGYETTTVNQAKTNLVHHYRALSMDASEYERMREQSAALIPKIMLEKQVKKKFH